MGVKIRGIEFLIPDKGGANARENDAAMRQLNEVMEKRRKELSDLKIPMKKASIFLDRWVQTNFRTEGKNVGGWKPFARGGRILPDGSVDPGAKLLQDSGRLRASFLPFATDDNAGIGSDLPYSENHQKGIGVAVRRLLPIDEEVLDDIRRIMSDHVIKAIDS